MSTESVKDRVIIFDTTLRDGEQSPGASMNVAQKLQVALALRDLGVDVIELGFPVASQGDFEAVTTVAERIEGPILCALARANREDIDRTWEALRSAARRRLHVFIATSPLHREYKLKMNQQEVVRRAVEAIGYARERFEDVQFSAEDAARTEPEFLAEVAERAIEAGATTINIPDTVGYTVPSQYSSLIAYLRRHVRGIERVVLSVHCHNDLGLAVANSLAAVAEGARQVECTINGIGERAGNCALEEVVMALRTRHDFFGVRTAVRTERLYPTSRLLSNVTGLQVQRNKAVVGQNAFAHEAGIHQHGMLMHPGTYEIMRPEDVGFSGSHLVLGKHSGRHVLRQRMKDLGYQLDATQLDKLFEEFKRLADRKKEVFDADLEVLIQGYINPGESSSWKLETLSCVSGVGTVPTASVCLEHTDGRKLRDAACGDGPVDAVFKAIERITGQQVRLCSYQVTSVTDGEDAQGHVSLEVETGLQRFQGRGVNTDIITASAQAFLDALNRAARITVPASVSKPVIPSISASA
ncbi:2-isopropylmalate synthase [Stigmatella aurantiaca]|uniref:2-isopropylmalate synthase n=1 Tax=Stigmatella aurantiaca (strain DW4/3-1) TaxID=378806 RepID=Q096Y3_STIAD|nr:2-isopropylmalate synthase [Stigmatella aurantiaca]ADO71398.1 2-isopropylmalate synthase [Stigmatella aurantiaca DW4/3-1]EAU67789.1 2-isopropylmalate synthase [Stigmatella aurantiaca DW4/3-1]